jgi:hypothetical protein
MCWAKNHITIILRLYVQSQENYAKNENIGIKNLYGFCFLYPPTRSGGLPQSLSLLRNDTGNKESALPFGGSFAYAQDDVGKTRKRTGSPHQSRLKSRASIPPRGKPRTPPYPCPSFMPYRHSERSEESPVGNFRSGDPSVATLPQDDVFFRIINKKRLPRQTICPKVF